MIHPHWQLTDLDPVTWRTIGPLFDPAQYVRAARPGERGLFLLHDGGRPLRVVDSATGPRPDLTPDRVDDPAALAQALFARGEWERVHVIDRRHLREVARRAQSDYRREQTLDGYYHDVYTLIWGNPDGYVAVPPHPGHWHGWRYGEIGDFVRALPTPATLALGVWAGEQLTIGLIGQVEGGEFVRVTTFEALPPDGRPTAPTAAEAARLWETLGACLAPPAALLLCTDAAFQGWLHAEDKAAALADAVAAGTAHLRHELGVGRWALGVL